MTVIATISVTIISITIISITIIGITISEGVLFHEYDDWRVWN